MQDMYDLSNMGERKLERAGELLKAYAKGRPEAWVDTGVKLAFNAGSGVVFITNDEFQTLELRDGKAEMLYALYYDGTEGFIDELYASFKNGDIDEHNYDELARYLEGEGMTAEAEEVREAIRNLKHEEEK